MSLASHWQDWLGFAGAVLLLWTLFLQLAGGRPWSRGTALLHGLGAGVLLPSAVAAFNAPVFFLLVAWTLAGLYGAMRGRSASAS